MFPSGPGSALLAQLLAACRTSLFLLPADFLKHQAGNKARDTCVLALLSEDGAGDIQYHRAGGSWCQHSDTGAHTGLRDLVATRWLGRYPRRREDVLGRVYTCCLHLLWGNILEMSPSAPWTNILLLPQSCIGCNKLLLQGVCWVL